ncbi:MAG: hypothetical protein MJY77_01920 [Bacteroidaceae bacterium]|nr:hypothetical protein [Bacteroidaceae bacterium]
MGRLYGIALSALCVLAVCSCHEEESRLVIIAPDETEYWKCCEYFPDIECICTGIGAGNIIRACSGLPKGTRIINIGYAGSNNLDIGDVRLVSDSYRYMEGQVVFTDYANPYHLSDDGIPCYTGNSFVTESDMTEPVLFDMELNYIAAFTPGLELVGSIKIVSNNLCMEEYLINTLLESDILKSDEVWSKVRDLVVMLEHLPAVEQVLPDGIQGDSE